MINPNAYNQACFVPCQDRRAAYAPRTRTTSLGHPSSPPLFGTRSGIHLGAVSGGGRVTAKAASMTFQTLPARCEPLVPRENGNMGDVPYVRGEPARPARAQRIFDRDI